MANEVSHSCSLSASKNGATVNSSGSKTEDLTGSEMLSSVQALSTTAALISVGGCDSIKAITIKNLDTNADGTANTATVTVSLDSSSLQVVSVIPAGGQILLLGCSTTLYAKSSAGTPDMYVTVVEN